MCYSRNLLCPKTIQLTKRLKEFNQNNACEVLNARLLTSITQMINKMEEISTGSKFFANFRILNAKHCWG